MNSAHSWHTVLVREHSFVVGLGKTLLYFLKAGFRDNVRTTDDLMRYFARGRGFRCEEVDLADALQLAKGFNKRGQDNWFSFL